MREILAGLGNIEKDRSAQEGLQSPRVECLQKPLLGRWLRIVIPAMAVVTTAP